jgi:hypothetical protein
MIKRVFFSIIASLGFISDEMLTFEYICDYPEMGPRFYGFPFIQETNASWIFSMSGDIYLIGFTGNLVLWAIIFFGVTLFLKKIKNKFLNKFFMIFGWCIVVLSVFITFINFAAIDWRLELTHDNFKMNYYENNINCERSFILSK